MSTPDWFNVSIERAKPGSLITAVAPTPDQLDLFVTAINGSIHSTFPDPASGCGRAGSRSRAARPPRAPRSLRWHSFRSIGACS